MRNEERRLSGDVLGRVSMVTALFLAVLLFSWAPHSHANIAEDQYRYVLQVGLFDDPQLAFRVVDNLRGQGYSPYVLTVQDGLTDRQVNSVRLAMFATFEEAEEAMIRFEEEANVFASIVAEGTLEELDHVDPGGWGTTMDVRRELDLRQGRSDGAEVVGFLEAGDRIKIDFLNDEWYAVFSPEERVRDESRALGYVRAPLLAVETASTR